MVKFIRIYEENPNPKEIQHAVNVLRKGGLVIYPTDTVYGLGCDITNAKAMEKIARIKGIKLAKANWSFICADLSNLSAYVRQIDTSTFKILKRHLPGPYTFILPRNNNLPKVFKKRKTVGIRIPDNAITQTLVATLGNPIVSTSIHAEDELIDYITDPELIYERWENRVDLVINGGYGGNIASTIIDLSDGEPQVIRRGKGTIDNFLD